MGDYTAYISKIVFCKDNTSGGNSDRNHRGFQVEWTDQTNTVVHTHDYGPYYAACDAETKTLPKVLTSFEVRADNDDVEGYRFVHAGGNEKVETANGGGGGESKLWMSADNLNGPLIGFTTEI